MIIRFAEHCLWGKLLVTISVLLQQDWHFAKSETRNHSHPTFPSQSLRGSNADEDRKEQMHKSNAY